MGAMCIGLLTEKRAHRRTPPCRSMSRGRALSVAKPAAGSGLKDAAQRNAAVKAGDRAQRRSGKMARKVRGSHIFVSYEPKIQTVKAANCAQRRSGKMARKVTAVMLLMM